MPPPPPPPEMFGKMNLLLTLCRLILHIQESTVSCWCYIGFYARKIPRGKFCYLQNISKAVGRCSAIVSH